MEITPIIREDFLIFDENATVSEMIGKMKQYEKSSALVFRNKKYLGLIEKTKLLKAKLDTAKAKIKNYLQKTPIISEHADVIETAYLLYQSNLNFVPVEREREMVGVVRALDIIKLAVKLPETSHLKAGDVKLVKSRVNKGDPISTAMTLMYQKGVDQVLVMEKEDVFGVLSFRDVLRKYLNWSPQRDVSAKSSGGAAHVAIDYPKLASLPVSSFSTNDNLAIININGSLKEAADLMSKRNISCLVVKDDGETKGLLTVKNILRAVGSLKIPQNYNIRFVGLRDLDLHSYYVESIKKIASNEAFKLQRQIRNDQFSLVVHFKQYKQRGGRHKYSVHLRIEFPGQTVTIDQEDWDLIIALRKTFNNAKNKVKKMFPRR